MDDNVHHASTQTGPAMGPKLEVVQGENAGEVFRLKYTTTLGRERDNDIVILDPKASRYHAEINFEDNQWVLKDLSSANGTSLNDAGLTTPTSLQTGDLIQLGETELLFQLPGHSSAQTRPAKIEKVGASAAPSEKAALPTTTLESPPPKISAVPASPSPQVQHATKSPPRLAWIAGAVILLVCIVAVAVVVSIVTGTDPDDTSGVDVPSPVAGSNGGEVDNGQTPAIQSANDSPELTLVYEDDFSDSFGGWDDAFDAYTRKVYGNNRYQVEVNTSNLVAWGLANRDVADFEIEVEARQEDGDIKSSYGLLFRFQDRENFYRFDISGDGFYLLSKFVDGEWLTLVDWTESEFINEGGASNILKVSAFGPNLTIYTNGQQLATVTDDSLSHGNFGFFAGTFSEPFTWVSYDNLKLWAPPGQEIIPIPTATRPSGVPVVEAPSPTPTAVPPTATPTSEPQQLVEGGSSAEATEEPTATATLTASPTPTVEPTDTPVPLPEYASRDQTLARGEERITGRIVFPVYDSDRQVYDIFIADAADGANLELVQADASQPGLTVDGAEIAYRSWQPDRRGLYARPLNGDDNNAWGFDLFFESARPQFSPIDSSLMYFSRTGGDTPATYRVIEGIGQVMRSSGFPIQGKVPKWSPDGQQFVYSSCLGSTCGVVLGNIDGSGSVSITDQPADTNPEISPDGSQIVFMSERGGNWEIYRVDIGGENLVALTSDPASDGLPTWSPDGSKIAFASNRDGEWSIWSMDADGSKKRRHFVIDGSIDGVINRDIANSFGWVEENIDWIP